jgi:hypothetical protein
MMMGRIIRGFGGKPNRFTIDDPFDCAHDKFSIYDLFISQCSLCPIRFRSGQAFGGFDN